MLVLNSKCRWWLEVLTHLPLLCSYWSYSCESSSWLVVSMSVCWREAWGPEFGFQHPNKKPGCKAALGERRKGRDRGFLGAVAALLVHKPVRDVPRWNKMKNG